MLDTYIKEEHLLVQQSCGDWEEVIEKGAEPLLKAGYIYKDYVEAIKKNHRELGPYMVIAPGIMLSHARPECGVKKLGLSVLTLKQPVCFGHEMNDPVDLIFTLASPDEISHMQLLEDLMELLLQPDSLADLRMAKTAVKAFSIIKRSEKQ